MNGRGVITYALCFPWARTRPPCSRLSGAPVGRLDRTGPTTTERVAEALVALGRERFRAEVLGDRGEGGLLMDEGLEFEARTALAIFKLAEPGKAKPTPEAVAEERARVQARDVDRYIADNPHLHLGPEVNPLRDPRVRELLKAVRRAYARRARPLILLAK